MSQYSIAKIGWEVSHRRAVIRHCLPLLILGTLLLLCSSRAGLAANGMTAGRTLDVLLQEQLARLLKIQGATLQQTVYFLNKNREITDALRRSPTVPGDIPPGLAALYPAYVGRLLHTEFTLSPTELAQRFTGPVLILQGARDVQVSAQSDAPALKAALRRRADDAHFLAVIPGASHNLKAVSSDTDPGLTGPVKEAALTALSSWLRAHL